MSAYYNEFDPYAAEWLRNLIKAGHIADGIVDERSIEDVAPEDLRDFTQCHFFAGIGVWSHALRRAGWDDSRPVWTGSCPCQPFSAAGAGAGFADPRHLWPAFAWLIEQCKPAIVFGEQVASKAVEPWVDLVHADLETMGYAFGAVPFPAAGVGAPHIRDRLYWLADLHRDGCEPRCQRFKAMGHGATAKSDCGPGRLAHANGRNASAEREQCCGQQRQQPQDVRIDGSDQRPSPVNGHWAGADWIGCRDNKWRPVEPGAFPLAHGLTQRVGRLRAYGNAICAQAAANFIGAYLDGTAPQNQYKEATCD